jgi:Skp family chaperone for outer membrane proteins
MRKTSVLAAGLWALAAVATAQEPAKSPKIAIIDLNRVSAESAMGKAYAAQIEKLENDIKAEGAKKQTDLQKLDTGIKALADELEKQQAVLSPEARDRKEQEILKKRRERDAYVEDGQRELGRMRERAQAQAEALNGDFQLKIRPHIEAAAKEKGIDIILNSAVALTVSKEFDITATVISKADAAPKTAALPAAPAPKPSPAASPN